MRINFDTQSLAFSTMNTDTHEKASPHKLGEIHGPKIRAYRPRNRRFVIQFRCSLEAELTTSFVSLVPHKAHRIRPAIIVFPEVDVSGHAHGRWHVATQRLLSLSPPHHAYSSANGKKLITCLSLV